MDISKKSLKDLLPQDYVDVEWKKKPGKSANENCIFLSLRWTSDLLGQNNTDLRE